MQSPYATHAFVMNYIAELDAIVEPNNSGVQVAPPDARQSTSHWRAPHMGVAKIQVDGGIARNRRSGAAAAVCRDHSGFYLGFF